MISLNKIKTIDGKNIVTESILAAFQERQQKEILDEVTIVTFNITSTVNDNNKITLFNLPNNVEIDWGDGITTGVTSTENLTADHWYKATGYYTCKIYNLTSISESMFDSCTSLTEIVKFSKDITEIEKTAFQFCSNLCGVTIPNTIKKIGEKAFYDSWVSSVTIEDDGVTEIGDYAFYSCFLGRIIVGSAVKIIGMNAFDGSYPPGSIITFKSTEPPVPKDGQSINWWASSNLSVFVPFGCLEKYVAVWKNYTVEASTATTLSSMKENDRPATMSDLDNHIDSFECYSRLQPITQNTFEITSDNTTWTGRFTVDLVKDKLLGKQVAIIDIVTDNSFTMEAQAMSLGILGTIGYKWDLPRLPVSHILENNNVSGFSDIKYFPYIAVEQFEIFTETWTSLGSFNSNGNFTSMPTSVYYTNPEDDTDKFFVHFIGGRALELDTYNDESLSVQGMHVRVCLYEA